jgi:hypothetical protein
LLLCARTRRVQHHRLEAIELLFAQRTAEEVAMIDEDGALRAVGGGLKN